MNAQPTDSTPVGATAAANTQVQQTIDGVSGKCIRLTFLALGYTGAAVSVPLQATISDGHTTMYLAVGNLQSWLEAVSIKFAAGATVTITLPAGGVGAVGNLAAAYYLDGLN